MWQTELTDLTGKGLCEVRGSTDRTISFCMGKPSTVGFTIRPDNPAFPLLYAADTLLRVWRDDLQEGVQTLVFNGIVVSAQLETDEESKSTIRVNAVDAAWRLSKRIVGKAKAGVAYSGDKGAIARSIIEEANTAGSTGIGFSATWLSSSTGAYTVGPYKKALTCINDLANGLDGFDWRIVPNLGGATIGLWKAEPLIGADRSKQIAFEFGVGKRNLSKVSYLRDLSSVANRAYHLPEDLETGEVISKEDATSIAERGLYETVAEASGINAKELREQWVQENVDVRKVSRKVLGLQLAPYEAGKVPKLGDDFGRGEFFVGDRIIARGVYNGVTLFNGNVRVYQIDVSLSESGRPTITPVLVDDNEEL
jgi:hypothetical protein